MLFVADSVELSEQILAKRKLLKSLETSMYEDK